MSFRNSEDSDRIWRTHGRIKSLRQRRSVEYSEQDDALNSNVFYDVPDDGSNVMYVDDSKDVIKYSRKKRSDEDEYNSNYKDFRDNVEFLESTDLDVGYNLDDEMTRNRRDTSKCVVNVNSQRQLSIGCSSEEIIEVDPQCTKEGDEGK